jgi:hypothetical protein
LRIRKEAMVKYFKIIFVIGMKTEKSRINLSHDAWCEPGDS